MKTPRILITVLLFSIGAAVKGQDVPYTPYPPPNPYDNRNKLQLGITGGFDISNLYDMYAHDFVASPLYGGVFGGFLSVPIGTFLGLQPEVLFAKEGFSVNGSDESGPFSYEKRSDYLQVPILLQFKPIPLLYLLGGPEYSYLLSNTYEFNSTTTSSTTEQEFSNNNLRHNILGVMLGADFNLGSLTLGGRVAWDLQYDNGNGASYLPRYRNVVEEFTAALRF